MTDMAQDRVESSATPSPSVHDVRSYIDVLVRHWKLMLAMVVLAAVAAAGVSLAIRPTFEATSVIVLVPATLSVPPSLQVPPYYLTVNSPQDLPTAYSPAFYIDLVDSVGASAGTAGVRVSVTSDATDKSLIEITAQGDDAAKVATTANKWAEAGVQRIQQALEPSGDQLARAQKNLQAAEQALVKFSQDNQLGDYDLAKLRAASLPTDKKLELEQMLRERDVAESVYMDAARTFQRAALLAETALKPSTLPATVPTSPVSPKLPRNIGVGAAFGLLVGVLSAFAADYIEK